MTEILQKLKSRGYWKVLIRPTDFVRTRVEDIQTLVDIIKKTAVEFRGWDFPHVSSHSGPSIGIDWIAQEVNWSEHVESWRLYQSGQFAFFGSMWEDWRDESIWEQPRSTWRPGAYLPVVDAVFRYTEIYEFAARLALTDAGAGAMTISITVIGLQGRELRIDHPNRSGFSFPRTCAISEFPYSTALPREQLIGEARNLALVNANELFNRFGWSPGIEFLRGMQEELWRR